MLRRFSYSAHLALGAVCPRLVHATPRSRSEKSKTQDAPGSKLKQKKMNPCFASKYPLACNVRHVDGISTFLRSRLDAGQSAGAAVAALREHVLAVLPDANLITKMNCVLKLIQFAAEQKGDADDSAMEPNLKHLVSIIDRILLEHKPPLEQIIAACPKLLGSNWFATDGTRSSVEERRVKSGNDSSAAAYITPPRGTIPDVMNSLPVVCGESGSGKTTFVLNLVQPDCPHPLFPWLAAYGVYLTCADLDSVDLQYFPDNDARNLAAVNTVAKGIRKAVGDVCVSLMRKDKENTLVLVAVDEIGTEPTLLRALCSINSDFSRQIRKNLGHSAGIRSVVSPYCCRYGIRCDV